MTPTPKPRVFFVDDEKDLAVSLAVKYENIYATEAFTSPHDALRRADQSVAVVVADQRMPHMTGLELLAKLRVKCPDTSGGAGGGAILIASSVSITITEP